MKLKEQLKANRTRLGLSQEELAERIYVSRQTISNWETDRTYPDVQSLLLLSEVFDASIDELVKGDFETMKKTIEQEWRKMQYLCLAAWALMLVGIACLAAGFAAQTGPSSVIPIFSEGELLGLTVLVLFLLFSILLLSKVERMKKASDLVTYRDVVAFSKGEEPMRDETVFGRRHPIAYSLLKLAVSTFVGGVIALLVMHVL